MMAKMLSAFFFKFDYASLLASFCAFFCVNKLPAHQSSSSAHAEISVSKPSRIDSRISGIERRYNVSLMADQSSPDNKTAFFRSLNLRALIHNPLLKSGKHLRTHTFEYIDKQTRRKWWLILIHIQATEVLKILVLLNLQHCFLITVI